MLIEQSGHGTVTIGSVEKYINDTVGKVGQILKLKRINKLLELSGLVLQEWLVRRIKKIWLPSYNL